MTPTVQQILTVTGIACDCTAVDITGPSQLKRLNQARRIAATLLKETRGMSGVNIAYVLNRPPNSPLLRCMGMNSPALTHARSLLAKLYADEQAMRIKNLTVGEVIAAIESRQDVAVAVGCYIGEVMRRKQEAVQA